MATTKTEALVRLKQKVRRSGLKLTKQRETICEAFFSKSGHRRAEEILLEARQVDSRVSLATVYRTLKLLQEYGLAEGHNFQDNQALFEPIFENHAHHDHLICTSCGLISEFMDSKIEQLQEKVATAHGFCISHHKMELYGLCQRCQNR